MVKAKTRVRSRKTSTKKTRAKKATSKKTQTQTKSKTKPKPRPKPTPTPHDAGAADRLMPPEGGAIVRFYRIGHGDCFLIAFASKTKDQPVYVLIDCGYKPGSPGKIDPPTSVDDIVANLKAATGGHVDVAVITHEHQDHVNGISAA